MTHTIIKSKNEVFHRLDKSLREMSMKTGKELRYGMVFLSKEDIHERGFEVVEEISSLEKYRFGYVS